MSCARGPRCCLWVADFHLMDYRWCLVGRPGCDRHIILEESGQVWGLETRLRFPDEVRSDVGRCLAATTPLRSRRRSGVGAVAGRCTVSAGRCSPSASRATCGGRGRDGCSCGRSRGVGRYISSLALGGPAISRRRWRPEAAPMCSDPGLERGRRHQPLLGPRGQRFVRQVAHHGSGGQGRHPSCSATVSELADEVEAKM